MEEELAVLLRSWQVEEEYVDNFIRQKVYKISTMLKLKEASLQKIFPEDGPLADFSDHLEKYKQNEMLVCDDNFHMTVEGLDNFCMTVEELNQVAMEVIVDEITRQFGASVSCLSKSPEKHATLTSPVLLAESLNSGEIVLHSDQSLLSAINEGTSTLEDDILVTAANSSARASNPNGNSEIIISCRNLSGDGGSNSSRPLEDTDEDVDCPLAKKQCVGNAGRFDLEGLCKQSIHGLLVLSYFKTNQKLDDSHQNFLADVILSDYLKEDFNKQLPHHIEEMMFQHIKKCFPSESKDIWVGQDKRSKSSGRGKLLNRYYNLRRIMLAGNLMQKGQTKGGTQAHAEPQEVIEVVNEALRWLQDNQTPWSRVEEFWKLTSKSRMTSLGTNSIPVHEYMNTYKAFKDPSGYLLFELDFDQLYPNSSMKLYIEWNMLSEYILSKLDVKGKETISDSLTTDGKKLRTILSLNKLFNVIMTAKKGKNQWRPSRLECMEGLFQLVDNDADITKVLDARKKKYATYGVTLGPQAVGVGKDEDCISTCYVVINQIRYQVESPLKAIDIVFKAMHALDTPYHKESRREWCFLQKAVYDFEKDSDPIDAKARTVVADYMDFKKKNSTK